MGRRGRCGGLGAQADVASALADGLPAEAFERADELGAGENRQAGHAGSGSVRRRTPVSIERPSSRTPSTYSSSASRAFSRASSSESPSVCSPGRSGAYAWYPPSSCGSKTNSTSRGSAITPGYASLCGSYVPCGGSSFLAVMARRGLPALSGVPLSEPVCRSVLACDDRTTPVTVVRYGWQRVGARGTVTVARLATPLPSMTAVDVQRRLESRAPTGPVIRA